MSRSRGTMVFDGTVPGCYPMAGYGRTGFRLLATELQPAVPASADTAL